MVLERLHKPLGRIDLAKLALNDAVRCAEAVAATGTNVHLLDDRAVTPPLRDQLRVGPNRKDMRARCVEDALNADLELVGFGHGGGIHQSPFVRSTTCAKRSSLCSQVLMPSKAYG